jgi:hypothetical protein
MSASSSYAATITIESDQIPTPPRSYSKKSIRDVPPHEDDPRRHLEMYSISSPQTSKSLVNSGQTQQVQNNSNVTEPRYHSSNSPPSHASDQIQTLWNPYKNRFRVLASCMAALGNGLNDSAPGALIASIEKYEFPPLLKSHG